MGEEEVAAVNLGTSLPVPCVQELAKNANSEIPERYIQVVEDEINDGDDDDDDASKEVPVIDLQRLLSDDPCELAKFHNACQHWGFFQLVNPGVMNSAVEKIKEEVTKMFNMGMEEKKKYWQKEGEVEGFGQIFVVSEEQKLDWADLFFITTLPSHIRNPLLYPSLPLSFRESLENYSRELKSLAEKILGSIGKAVEIKKDEIEGIFEDGFQSMRMNYYPPCPQPHKVIGLTPHSDATGLTILLQLDQVQGLQIKNNGRWIPINPLPDAFVINLGDILEIMTNGIYRSIEHRAIVNSEKERISIATFYAPKYETEIGPAPSLINPQNPPLFRRIRVDEFFKAYFARELRGKSFIDTLRI